MARPNMIEQDEFLAVEKPVSRISWGGIFVGAFATIALGVLLNALGAAIGLTAINPARGDWGSAGGIWTGIWSFISIVVATFIGAMIASKASTLFFRRDAGAQGFMVWAMSFLAMLFFVTTMVGGALSTSATAASSAAAGAGSAVQGQSQQLQQQLQQQLPTQQQAQQAVGSVADVGAAATWWFFITALISMLAGVFGGMAGLPKQLRSGKTLEVRRRAPLQTRETHA